MRWGRQSRLALGSVLAAALLLGDFLSGAEGAAPKPGAQLHRQRTDLTARSPTALLSLYALDSRLAQARAELARLRTRIAALRLEQQRVRRVAGVVEGNLRASQRLLATHLRRLYEQGEPDGVAVVLGATSFDEAVTRLDELERTAHQGADVAADARAGRVALRRLAARLARRVRATQGLAARAEQTALALAEARAARVAYLASLARRQRLKPREIAALDARAKKGVARAESVQISSGATRTAAAPSVVSGPQTLTVTATGYSLPGHTATGMPVGPGVAAVDPSVIPMGTRMTIPGYGEAVAADTGSAVQGYMVDLWFPNSADALAWGRRTVTITLH